MGVKSVDVKWRTNFLHSLSQALAHCRCKITGPISAEMNEWVLRSLVDPIRAAVSCQWHGFGVAGPEFECSLL